MSRYFFYSGRRLRTGVGIASGHPSSDSPRQSVSHAIVVDNDVNMSAHLVLNNRIRGRANFGLSVIAQAGTPLNTTFITNDLQGFTSAQADVFVDAGGTGTVAVGDKAPSRITGQARSLFRCVKGPLRPERQARTPVPQRGFAAN
jgi:hypothetical protein